MKNKKPMYYFETEKKRKEQELTKLQAELTTLKSKRLDGTILMDLGNWYTIRESFKHNGKEPKIKVR
jgi:exonuclease SbcC